MLNMGKLVIQCIPGSPLLAELAKKISNSLGDPGETCNGGAGPNAYRRTGPTVPNPSTYEPSLLVIAQGRFEWTSVNGYVFGQSRFLVTSLELPVMSQVITASEKAPHLAFFLKLDMSTVRDILNTEEVHILRQALASQIRMATETTVWSPRWDCGRARACSGI